MSARGLFAMLLAAAIAAPAAAQDGFPARYLPGEHYRSLSEPAPTADAGIEVIEFFFYGCPHCHSFEPTFRDWAADAPEDVHVRRIPVIFNERGLAYARLFYTAHSLGVLEEVHGDVFAAIHERGRRLTERSAIRAFFGERGVDGAVFDRTFDSDEVQAKMRRAAELAQAYGVTSVPSLGVNGRYWISGAMANGQDGMPAVAEYLIARERDDR